MHDGVIDALLVYKNTGIACRPDWNNNSIDSYGYQLIDGKIKTNYVPKASEVLDESYNKNKITIYTIKNQSDN